MIDCLELLAFTIGILIFLRQFWRILVVISRLYFGTKVTTQRYGENSWAIVTGSTDGIGKRIAIELAKRGFNIVQIARNPEKLQAVSQEIQQKHNRQTRDIVFDFGKDVTFKSYQDLIQRVADLDVSVVVNNVGMCNDPNKFENTLPKDHLNECIVNCYPMVMFTKVVIDKLKQRYAEKKLRTLILNVSSLAVNIPQSYLASQCGTKMLCDRFSKSLNYEMRGSGIDMLTLQPGMVSTNRTGFEATKQGVVTPEQCAVGALNNATSFETFGTFSHEIMNLFVLNLIMDFIPWKYVMIISRKIGENLVFKRKQA
ncbi:short chain dehydrogenase reductase family protein [Stylonychia lemnae]|uniref:Short chain dehydrogenase reductase family protein n=1 Tax=Stylonychia lemnae TaxID=5949 RepID=A0A078B1W8_STYLE|nr:short chain dehydrogenase reductase family protein [Stylonychia lemnae]|eukprot:CDW88550.1 short chain dehydrogenase reductase family protein [Stylonychia lemnae]